jgi:hypothetical protein
VAKAFNESGWIGSPKVGLPILLIKDEINRSGVI